MRVIDVFGPVLLGVALAPWLSEGRCSCNVFVVHQPGVLGEEIVRGDQGTSDCVRRSSKDICRRSCMRTSVFSPQLGDITSGFKLRVIESTLSPSTVRSLCSRPFLPEEGYVTSLRLGGYYKWCDDRWEATGIVRNQKVCCLGNRTADCRMLNARAAGPLRRPRRAAELVAPPVNRSGDSAIAGSDYMLELTRSRLKAAYQRYHALFDSLLSRWKVKPPAMLSEAFQASRKGLQQFLSVIRYRKDDLNETTLLRNPGSMLNRAAQLYLDYFHELGLGYCYTEHLASYMWVDGGGDLSAAARSLSINDASRIVDLVTSLLGGNTSSEMAVFVDQVIPLAADIYRSPMVKNIISGFFLKPPPRKTSFSSSSSSAEDNSIDDGPAFGSSSLLEEEEEEEVGEEEYEEDAPAPHRPSLMKLLLDVVKSVSSNPPIHGHRKPPRKKAPHGGGGGGSAKPSAPGSAPETPMFAEQLYERIMEALRTVFISVFDVVPGRYYTKLDRLLVPLLNSKTPEVFFTPIQSPKQLRLVNRNLDKRYDDGGGFHAGDGGGGGDKYGGGFSGWMLRLDDSSSAWHCLKNYVVSKLFKMASTSVKSILGS